MRVPLGEPVVKPQHVAIQTIHEIDSSRLEPIQVLDPPVPLPVYSVKQHWHERFHADAGHAWLRKTFAELFARPERKGAGRVVKLAAEAQQVET